MSVGCSCWQCQFGSSHVVLTPSCQTAGKDDVWSYWFKKFAPQYAGLPSLGRVEDIYNQQDVSVCRSALYCTAKSMA